MIRHLPKLVLPLLFVLGSASAGYVKPEWIRADFNGDGRQDVIATSNLADVVFNPEGEIIFWHVKINPGQVLIQNQNGVYNFNSLKDDRNINLLRKGGQGLRVILASNTAKPSAETIQTSQDVAASTLTAKFNYVQGDFQVSKTVVVHPRQFKIDVYVNVTGAPGALLRTGTPNYQLSFDGLGKNQNPEIKAVSRGGQFSTTPGNVQNLQYVALQDRVSGFYNNTQASSALIVRPDQATTATANITGGAKANLLLNLSGPAKFQVYGGKNELIHLYQEGFTDLPQVFTPNWLGDISLALVKLMEWLYSFLRSWGLVILAITVLIRLAMWPIMQSQGKMTAKMQMIQPLVKELQDKHKDDPQKLQAETMRVYREYNVNPAGCLTTFLTLPILSLMWSTMRNFEFDSGLWWLPDLSIPDPFYVLAVLYVLVNLGQMYVTTRKTPQMFKQQAPITLIFAYFAITFPAGVTLYWIISTLIGIGQQLLINRQVEATMSAGLQKVVRPARPAPAGSTPASKVITAKPAPSKPAQGKPSLPPSNKKTSK